MWALWKGSCNPRRGHDWKPVEGGVIVRTLLQKEWVAQDNKAVVVCVTCSLFVCLFTYLLEHWDGGEQGPMCHRLSADLPYDWGWPRTSDFLLLYLPSTKAAHLSTQQLYDVFYKELKERRLKAPGTCLTLQQFMMHHNTRITGEDCEVFKYKERVNVVGAENAKSPWFVHQLFYTCVGLSHIACKCA